MQNFTHPFTRARRGGPGRLTGRLASAVLALMLTCGMMAVPAKAQQTLNIRAVVNDEAISAYDVEQRLNLVIRSSGLPDTERVRRDLAARVLDSLVDEALQLQEAKRLGITVSKSEIDAAIALIERQNRIPPGEMGDFLKRQRIDQQSLTRQIEASIAWGNIVRRQLMRTITISDEEVAKALERIKANADKPRILAAEIFLAVDSPREEAAARSNAQRIFDEIRRGASFPQMARQFSQAASAERGGDLGWILPGELEPEVDKALASLPKGAVTEPIRTATGFYIISVRDRREPEAKSLGDTVVALRQVLLALPRGATPAALESQKQLAESIRGAVRGCDDFDSVSKELGAGASSDLGRLKLSELPDDIRRIVSALDVGAPSPPLVTDDSVRLLMVCERKSPAEAALPSTEDIQRRLTVQRLEVRARRYLRELRESAFLDIRA